MIEESPSLGAAAGRGYCDRPQNRPALVWLTRLLPALFGRKLRCYELLLRKTGKPSTEPADRGRWRFECVN